MGPSSAWWAKRALARADPLRCLNSRGSPLESLSVRVLRFAKTVRKQAASWQVKPARFAPSEASLSMSDSCPSMAAPKNAGHDVAHGICPILWSRGFAGSQQGLYIKGHAGRREKRFLRGISGTVPAHGIGIIVSDALRWITGKAAQASKGRKSHLGLVWHPKQVRRLIWAALPRHVRPIWKSARMGPAGLPRPVLARGWGRLR